MTRRVAINLLVFAVLGVVMVVWAFRNVVRFDFIDRPYRITVEFESSPGLHPGFEVDYLGVRVGKIDSVRLAGDRVVVRLDIERGVRIPQGVTAAAARKSAVGEPVVELTPGPGQGDAPPLRPGAVIPVSKTTVPPKYSDLFDSVLDSLEAIDPDDARVLTHELAEGWSGRDGSLRQIIRGSDRLTAAFAGNSELLDGLTRDLGKITEVLNRNRGRLGEGIDDLAALTAALRQVRGELTRLRDDGPELLDTVNGLLDETTPDFECAVDTLANWGIRRHNPDPLDDLRRTLEMAPQLNEVLRNVVGQDRGLPVLNVVFLVTLKEQAALEYRYPLPQPRVSPIPDCPDGRRPGVTEQKPYKAEDPGETIPTHDPSVQQADGDLQARNAAGRSAQDGSGGPPGWLLYLPPLLAVLVLIRVAAGSVPVLSRLRRGRR
ncbi:MlaD family protein [Actinomadura keratinilytica]|jgi:phospholipid/cholesterol/gamma-HCH transport system substrate-binding protein|uniref:Mce/MlaD domain-containing protein n=1 Tax=Actinomadura keratinilytica TaxID=547461 RepID=A0ABP7YB35_9ACTN